MIGKLIKSKRLEHQITQEQLAVKAGVPYATLTKIESGAIKSPSAISIQKLTAALGITNDSVLTPKIYTGEDVLKRIFKDVLSTLQTPGDYMCISGIDERRYLKTDSKAIKQFIEDLKARGFKQKLLSCEGDTFFLKESHVEYRWIPKKHFNPNPIYVYGNKFAAIIWGPPMQLMIIDNAIIADAYRKQFLFIWEKAKKI